MNKADLIQRMAADAGVSKDNAGRVLESFMRTVQHELARKGCVALVGFGSFTVGARAARSGRNPITGAVVEIPARHAVKFTPGKALKDAVNT